MSVSERAPFLDFDPNSDLTLEDESAIYCSLVALVSENHPFDKALQDKASQFLSSLSSKTNNTESADKYLTDLAHPSDGTISGFIRSIHTLTSSPHSTVVVSSLGFVITMISKTGLENRYHLAASDLMSNVFATVQPYSLTIS
ncbi:hypothetical protein BLNAU_2121 [Blattamonas nauphoetae]|uniref:Uncharacterized protein n=1 Tax=Blattamonas nauphoetae TaxID=2049346 RepID=A0ABQ9YH99_9EUKA|nr:hypothetical protein BLNAU_2121 [Blattamonas nauphoetae]